MLDFSTTRRALVRLTVAGLLVGALVAPAFAEGEANASSWFEDRTAQAGVDRPHTNRSFENPYAHIMEGYTALGAAVATADYNRDGFDDLFVTDSKLGGKNFLYRNNGDFTFTEVGEQAGLSEGNDEANAIANALWFDHNNDQWPDLLVIRFGTNLLYENQGDGTFKDITKGEAFSQYLNCIAAVSFDYDLDGDMDLFLGNYFMPVNLFNPETSKFFPESFETAANGGGVTVLRNDGDGNFVDVTDAVGMGKVSGWTLDVGHADLDHDGDEDLYVAADFGTDNIFVNNGDGTFSDSSIDAIGIDTKKGMNVDWGDFDGDGYFDVYVTNITDEYMNEGNFLWRNNGDGTFSDVARETGTHNTGWGWAGKFFDVDNDTWQDLYVVNGWVSAGPENYVLDVFEMIVTPNIDLAEVTNWPPMGNKTLSGYQKNSLFHNQGGTFVDIASEHGVAKLEDGRGVAVVDLDNDGRLDLFVSNANNKPFLWRNVQPNGNHWIQLVVEGTKYGDKVKKGEKATPPSGVGARVKATVDGFEVWSFANGGNGFASQSTPRVHLGLGETKTIEKLEIFWPSGLEQTFTNVAADQIYKLVEGTDALTPVVAKAAGDRQGKSKDKKAKKSKKKDKKKGKKSKKSSGR